MSSIKISPNASGTGEFVIAAPNSNTNRTLTLPDATGTINTSGAVNEVPAGSASAPSIYPAGDTNTGIFFPAADTIAFTEGGTESMRIDSSGRVGIGSTSPSTYADATTSLVLQTSSGRSGITLVGNHSTADEILGRINFTDSGSTNAAYRNAIIDGVRGSDDNSAYLTFSTSNSGNPAERARITSNGDVLLGTTATWGTTNGRSVFISNNADSQTLRISNGDTGSSPYGLIGFFRNQGALIARISTDGSSVAYNTTSDYRLKENVIPMTGALEKVAQLNPVTYTWKATGKSSQGFIAHELAEVVPDCVSGDKDAVNEDGSIDPQGVDTSFLVATLTAAIQELKAINDAQATRIETLETKVAALEAK